MIGFLQLKVQTDENFYFILLSLNCLLFAGLVYLDVDFFRQTMKKSPVHPKYEMGFDGSNRFDPQNDFYQVRS